MKTSTVSLLFLSFFIQAAFSAPLDFGTSELLLPQQGNAGQLSAPGGPAFLGPSFREDRRAVEEEQEINSPRHFMIDDEKEHSGTVQGRDFNENNNDENLRHSEQVFGDKPIDSVQENPKPEEIVSPFDTFRMESVTMKFEEMPTEISLEKHEEKPEEVRSDVAHVLVDESHLNTFEAKNKAEGFTEMPINEQSTIEFDAQAPKSDLVIL